MGGGFGQIFGKIVSIRIKTLTNTNQVASKPIIREKASPPLDVGPLFLRYSARTEMKTKDRIAKVNDSTMAFVREVTHGGLLRK